MAVFSDLIKLETLHAVFTVYTEKDKKGRTEYMTNYIAQKPCLLITFRFYSIFVALAYYNVLERTCTCISLQTGSNLRFPTHWEKKTTLPEIPCTTEM